MRGRQAVGNGEGIEHGNVTDKQGGSSPRQARERAAVAPWDKGGPENIVGRNAGIVGVWRARRARGVESYEG
jgi:hypothetical protein